MRGSSPVICWWIATMLIPSLRMALSTVCNSFSVMAKSPSMTASCVTSREGSPSVHAHFLADGSTLH